jgi:hypothetical protein
MRPAGTGASRSIGCPGRPEKEASLAAVISPTSRNSHIKKVVLATIRPKAAPAAFAWVPHRLRGSGFFGGSEAGGG